ncbi:hypothetical protein BC829DRAFT_445152 [Chytridium lagenaria]|nr:hypothetical protein BC829DRAFT_445152 [Chytridium lagenaria]
MRELMNQYTIVHVGIGERIAINKDPVIVSTFLPIVPVVIELKIAGRFIEPVFVKKVVEDVGDEVTYRLDVFVVGITCNQSVVEVGNLKEYANLPGPYGVGSKISWGFDSMSSRKLTLGGTGIGDFDQIWLIELVGNNMTFANDKFLIDTSLVLLFFSSCA